MLWADPRGELVGRGMQSNFLCVPFLIALIVLCSHQLAPEGLLHLHDYHLCLHPVHLVGGILHELEIRKCAVLLGVLVERREVMGMKCDSLWPALAHVRSWLTVLCCMRVFPSSL